jgi:sulfite oxidase
MYRAWAWTFWTVEVQKPKGKFQVVCKAVDSAGNQQPQNIDQVWNIRGLNNNSWHRVDVD